MASYIINRSKAARLARQGPPLETQSTPQLIQSPTVLGRIPTAPMPRDRNAPDHRLQLNSRCIYERRLPGGSYITCHVDRLQSGFYNSPSIHQDSIENLRFVTLHFVFHPGSTTNRFTRAFIRVGVRNARIKSQGPPSTAQEAQDPGPRSKKTPRRNPSILRHAPHLLFGAISPESLQWNFNMAGSLGVAQAPVSATLSPSAGLQTSYKRYEMMRIQGSLRTYRPHSGFEEQVEDGEVVWSLEEDRLQRSGLPREFTFVVLLQKSAADADTMLDLHIDPVVNSKIGHFPSWWLNLLPFRPLRKPPLDLDHETGQKFEPGTPGRGYNFASLLISFEDFISLPGTTYSTSDQSGNPIASLKTDTTKTPISQSMQNSVVLGVGTAPADDTQDGQQQAQAQTPNSPPTQQNTPQSISLPLALFSDNTLNVRVFVEHASSAGPYPGGSAPEMSAGRTPSLRRSKSRDGLGSEYDGTAHDAKLTEQTNASQDVSPPAHARSSRSSVVGASRGSLSRLGTSHLSRRPASTGPISAAEEEALAHMRLSAGGVPTDVSLRVGSGLLQTTGAEDDALANGQSTRARAGVSAGDTARRAQSSPHGASARRSIIADDDTLELLQSSRASVGSVPAGEGGIFRRASLQSHVARRSMVAEDDLLVEKTRPCSSTTSPATTSAHRIAPLRSSVLEKMREMEERIRALDEIEKREKAGKIEMHGTENDAASGKRYSYPNPTRRSLSTGRT